MKRIKAQREQSLTNPNVKAQLYPENDIALISSNDVILISKVSYDDVISLHNILKKYDVEVFVKQDIDLQ